SDPRAFWFRGVAQPASARSAEFAPPTFDVKLFDNERRRPEMTRQLRGRPGLAAVAAGMALALMASTATAQQNEQKPQPRASNPESGSPAAQQQNELRIPSETAMIGLRARPPAEVRVGESFS